MRTLEELRRWADDAPDGTSVPVESLRRALVDLPLVDDGVTATSETEPWGWRERLWTVPAETRLGTREVLEALGRSESWLYHRTGQAAADPIPCRRMDGVLVVTAGELRAWIRSREEVIHAGPMESSPAERRLAVVIP